MPSDMGRPTRPPVDFSKTIAKAEIAVRNGIVSFSRRRKRFALFLIILVSLFFYWRSGSDSQPEPVGTDPAALLDTRPDITSQAQEDSGIDTYTYFPNSPMSALHDGRYSAPDQQPTSSPLLLTPLTRALLLTLPMLHITPWLSSTALLGWHWQRSLLPFSPTSPATPPLIHLSFQDFTHLASHYNGTTYSYPSVSPDLTQETNTTYLLDISPFYSLTELAATSSGNAIDARFIDTTTGLFIALTAVSPSSSSISDEKDAQRGKGAKKQKFLRTRDGRSYESKLVYPLQKTHFEGVECWVPGAGAVLLAQEFGKGALSSRISNGYRFDAKTQRWISMKKTTT